MKVGIYIDGENINRNGGYNMRYDVLKAYCSQNELALRMNTYLSYDAAKAEQDENYKKRQNRYYSILRNFGFKVKIKQVKWFFDENGERYAKANADLDMAVDMLLQAQKLDKIYLLTGDGDFKMVVQALQNYGIRVEVIAFDNVSAALRYEADVFTAGYVIPNLLPFEKIPNNQWGQIEHKVRGICYHLQEKFGFMRYMNEHFQYKEAFFHVSAVKGKNKAELERIYEFTLKEGGKGIQAEEIKLIL